MTKDSQYPKRSLSVGVTAGTLWTWCQQRLFGSRIRHLGPWSNRENNKNISYHIMQIHAGHCMLHHATAFSRTLPHKAAQTPANLFENKVNMCEPCPLTYLDHVFQDSSGILRCRGVFAAFTKRGDVLCSVKSVNLSMILVSFTFISLYINNHKYTLKIRTLEKCRFPLETRSLPGKPGVSGKTRVSTSRIFVKKRLNSEAPNTWFKSWVATGKSWVRHG